MKWLMACWLVAGSLAAREVTELAEGWRFFQGGGEGFSSADFDDSSWAMVTVPHDWSIAGPFKEDAATGGAGAWMPSGVAWYRREVEGAGGGAAWLEFDGVMAHSEVFWNGEKVGGWPYGYSTFRVDLTGKVLEGANELAVKTDTSAQPASRWYTGAGIYRKARFVEAADLHVLPDGVVITTRGESEEKAALKISAEFSRELEAGESAEFVLVDASGSEVARGALRSGEANIELPNPSLWSLKSPSLYRATVMVRNATGEVDRVEFPFGIRKAEFLAESGFWLNGENLKIKGVCLHHDGGAVGAAVPLGVWERRLGILKSLGVNGIRTAHNPPDPGFLDLCDRMGFVVMDEAFDCWTKGKNKADYNRDFKDWWERDLRAMVKRDRNHPCVVLYSVGNEIRDTHDTELAKGILADLVRVCHEEDPTRPVTQALFRPNTTHDYDNGLADLLDVVGTNYRDLELLDAWKDKPSRKIIGTEQGHERSTWFNCRDHVQHAGQFLWCGIDYLGESRSWPVTSYNAGLLDRTGHIQPRGWERKSWWSDEPMVKCFRRIAATEATPADPGYEVVEWQRRQVLFPDWNAEEGKVNVEIYSNAAEVELFLNDRSLGAKPVKKDFALNWEVPFEPGTLRAEARNEGKVVAEDLMVTAGEAAGLKLAVDREQIGLSTDDVGHLELLVVDGQGVPVPNAFNPINFQIEGPGEIIGVDNGSIVSHESFVATERKAFQGRVLAIVRATGEGKIKVTVTGEGLKPATVVIQAGK